MLARTLARAIPRAAARSMTTTILASPARRGARVLRAPLGFQAVRSMSSAEIVARQAGEVRNRLQGQRTFANRLQQGRHVTFLHHLSPENTCCEARGWHGLEGGRGQDISENGAQQLERCNPGETVVHESSMVTAGEQVQCLWAVGPAALD